MAVPSSTTTMPFQNYQSQGPDPLGSAHLGDPSSRLDLFSEDAYNNILDTVSNDQVTDQSLHCVGALSEKAIKGDTLSLELLANLTLRQDELGYHAACALLSADQSGNTTLQSETRRLAYQIMSAIGHRDSRRDKSKTVDFFTTVNQGHPLVQLASLHAEQHHYHTEFSVKANDCFQAILHGEKPNSSRFIDGQEITAAIKHLAQNQNVTVHIPEASNLMIPSSNTIPNDGKTHLYPYLHTNHWLLLAHDTIKNTLVIFNSLKEHNISPGTMHQFGQSFGIEQDKIVHLNAQGLQSNQHSEHSMPNDCGLLVVDAMRYLTNNLTEDTNTHDVLTQYINACHQKYGNIHSEQELTNEQQQAREVLHLEGRYLLLALFGLDQSYNGETEPHRPTPSRSSADPLTCSQQAHLTSSNWQGQHEATTGH